MTLFDNEQKLVLLTLDIMLKWSPLILKAYNNTKRLKKNKIKLFVNHRWVFLHLHIEKYFKDKFTIKYFFSVHARS